MSFWHMKRETAMLETDPAINVIRPNRNDEFRKVVFLLPFDNDVERAFKFWIPGARDAAKGRRIFVFGILRRPHVACVHSKQHTVYVMILDIFHCEIKRSKRTTSPI